jgi:hypothetical protein
MRGKEIKAIAKKSLRDIFKKGDEVIVQSILRKEDVVIMRAIGGVFDAEDKFLFIASALANVHIAKTEVGEKVDYKKVSEYGKAGQYITKMFEPVIAKKGDYYDNVIIVNDREYCGQILGHRPLSEYFEKVV